MFGLALSPIASKIIKWLSFTLLVVAAFLMGYWKGSRDTKARYLIKEQQETLRRIDESQKEVEHGRQFKEKVRRHRDSSPINDLRDQCLLSSNNPTEDCAEHLQ